MMRQVSPEFARERQEELLRRDLKFFGIDEFDIGSLVDAWREEADKEPKDWRKLLALNRAIISLNGGRGNV